MACRPRHPWARWFSPALLPLGLVRCADTGSQVYVLGRLPASADAAVALDGRGGPDAPQPGPADGSVRPDANDGASAHAPPPVEDAGSDDASSRDVAGCGVAGVVRDYDFSGTGTTVVDRLGGSPGTLRGGAVLDGSGELVLDGRDDYVDLPNGLLSGLTEMTVAAWVRHRGGPAYTRVFDFGVGNDGEDPAEGLGTVGLSYVAVTPATGFVPNQLAALVSRDGSGGEIAAPTPVHLEDVLQLVALSISAFTLELSHNGVVVAREPNSVPVESIDAVNNWLGRSQYDQDPYWSGVYTRVQVYDRALSACALRALFDLGPDG